MNLAERMAPHVISTHRHTYLGLITTRHMGKMEGIFIPLFDSWSPFHPGFLHGTSRKLYLAKAVTLRIIKIFTGTSIAKELCVISLRVSGFDEDFNIFVFSAFVLMLACLKGSLSAWIGNLLW